MQILTEAIITQRLAEALTAPHEDSPFSAFLSDAPRPAAVLIPIFCASMGISEPQSWQILLTRRTESVAEHRGQVAFPGGRADPSDTSPEQTALREAQEEIGLIPDQVRLLGRMNSLWTISNYLVTPVVGVIPWPFPIKLEEIEVSRAFSIPLDWLADPAHHDVRMRQVPSPYSQLLHHESHPVIYFQSYNGEVLWGVSAEITLNLIQILYRP